MRVLKISNVVDKVSFFFYDIIYLECFLLTECECRPQFFFHLNKEKRIN